MPFESDPFEPAEPSYEFSHRLPSRRTLPAALAGEQTALVDPLLERFVAWQPNVRVTALQRGLIGEMAALHGR